MNQFRNFIPTIIRAAIFNIVMQSFRGKRGVITLVILLALYFINAEFGFIQF